MSDPSYPPPSTPPPPGCVSFLSLLISVALIVLVARGAWALADLWFGA